MLIEVFVARCGCPARGEKVPISKWIGILGGLVLTPGFRLSVLIDFYFISLKKVL